MLVIQNPNFQHEAFAVCSCAIRLTSMTFEVTATLTKALRPLGKHTWSSMGNRIFTIRELFLLTGKNHGGKSLTVRSEVFLFAKFAGVLEDAKNEKGVPGC